MALLNPQVMPQTMPQVDPSTGAQQPQQGGMLNGLQNFLQSPQAMSFAMGMMNAAGPSRMPVSMGQALAAGYGNMNEVTGQQLQNANSSMDLQTKQIQMQMMQANMQQAHQMMTALQNSLAPKAKTASGNAKSDDGSQSSVFGNVDLSTIPAGNRIAAMDALRQGDTSGALKALNMGGDSFGQPVPVQMPDGSWHLASFSDKGNSRVYNGMTPETEETKALAGSDASTITQSRADAFTAMKALQTLTPINQTIQQLSPYVVGPLAGKNSQLYNQSVDKLKGLNSQLSLLAGELLGMKTPRFSPAAIQMLQDISANKEYKLDTIKANIANLTALSNQAIQYNSTLESSLAKNGTLTGATSQFAQQQAAQNQPVTGAGGAPVQGATSPYGGAQLAFVPGKGLAPVNSQPAGQQGGLLNKQAAHSAPAQSANSQGVPAPKQRQAMASARQAYAPLLPVTNAKTVKSRLGLLGGQQLPDSLTMMMQGGLI